MKLKSTNQQVHVLPSPEHMTEAWKKTYQTVLIPHPRTKRGYLGQVCTVRRGNLDD